MKSVKVDEKYSGTAIEKFIKKQFPELSTGAMHRAFRKKDVKVNGVRVRQDYILSAGDIVEIFLADKFFEGTGPSQKRNTNLFDVVHNDKNIIIVNKAQGVPVHPDQNNDPENLIEQVQLYLMEKGETLHSFKPSLCHRIDRNTGGLVIIAKNPLALKTVIDKLKKNEIRKYYLCLVKGVLEEQEKLLKDYLIKDSRNSRVFIFPEPKGNSSFEIITKYKVVSAFNDMSLLEVELLTGRTHQIRAHLAYIGHPIVGDGKYGDNSFNRAQKAKYQALWAYKLRFGFSSPCPLDYLNGKTFEVNPGFQLPNLSLFSK
ncbi:MAG TPA: RluA family pseudouridine synthase [Clostridiaceae bacterium]|jgi:23S rRNA pseudouridine955/2504/2580 synthase|nr:RluA family pseudouridine synthase [Clostridiaceae bacterium]